MDDPVLRALENAPLDDEPLTQRDEIDLCAAYADLAAGLTITTAEMRRRLAIVRERRRREPPPTEEEYRIARDLARKLGRIP